MRGGAGPAAAGPPGAVWGLFGAAQPPARRDHAYTTPPNQPAYPSGHSCIEGATSQVLAHLFPREAAVFQSCAEELAKSRWWARIHHTWDNNDGLTLGRGVAAKVIEWAKADGAQ